ncbi:MAG: bifunctional riboflavin kinase/FAD synthetase [Actinomycetota bacterium]|nr:bifunctional riboflavin kinase/FAD synthetase [Actinomycetota bacterium]
MKVARGLKDLPKDVKPSVCTVGVFDGVHKGHQALMGQVLKEAQTKKGTPVVVTFDRHPLELIAPGKEPPIITTPRQRAEAMESLGIEVLLILKFDDALRHLSPEDFVQKVLIDALGCVHVVVGKNFRFGHQHAGTVETLQELGKTDGFTVEIFDLVGDDEVVSSTLIRRQIAEGNVEVAAQELGRPFRIEGHVEHGAKRGKGLGFPTANLRVPDKFILPKIGVYAGWLRWKGRRYPTVVNVGLNPTFEDRTSPIVEAYVLDFDRDLYGEVVGVEFTHHLRDELKFDDVEDLKKAIGNDVKRARELLGV